MKRLVSQWHEPRFQCWVRRAVWLPCRLLPLKDIPIIAERSAGRAAPRVGCGWATASALSSLYLPKSGIMPGKEEPHKIHREVRVGPQQLRGVFTGTLGLGQIRAKQQSKTPARAGRPMQPSAPEQAESEGRPMGLGRSLQVWKLQVHTRVLEGWELT